VEEAKAAEAAERAVTTLGLSRDVSPSEALLEEVRWTAGHVDWLRDRVREVERDELVWGKAKWKQTDSADGPIEETVETAATSVWYDLYEKERKHLVVVCTAALRAGVEERRVRLAEAQGEQVAAVIKAILGDLQLTAAQQERVGEVVPRRLRLLASANG